MRLTDGLAEALEVDPGDVLWGLVSGHLARSVAARIEAAADEAKPPFKDRGNGWLRSSSRAGLMVENSDAES